MRQERNASRQGDRRETRLGRVTGEKHESAGAAGEQQASAGAAGENETQQEQQETTMMWPGRQEIRQVQQDAT